MAPILRLTLAAEPLADPHPRIVFELGARPLKTMMSPLPVVLLSNFKKKPCLQGCLGSNLLPTSLKDKLDS